MRLRVKCGNRPRRSTGFVDVARRGCAVGCRSGFGFCLRRWVVRFALRWHPPFAFSASCVAVRCFGFFAGIRVMPSCFKRRPCAGRHLLFFAAAKKSTQKKAANTANISSCLRAPNRSYASHGNVSFRPRCQRAEWAPHRLRIPVHGLAAANGLRRPGGKLCVGCRGV